MNAPCLSSFIAVLSLFFLAYLGVQSAVLKVLFGIVIPYLAVVTFIAGLIYRIMYWAASPVPFRVPVTGGQQKSLPWIPSARIDNPSTPTGVVVRMLFEILFFRSLLKNTRCEIQAGPKLVYIWEKWLWLAALAFHWSLFMVLARHFRFFIDPIPPCLKVLEKIDGFLQVGLPGVYLSGIVLLAALFYLFSRRIFIAQVHYISLASDYFPLFLLLGVAISGILMRYYTPIDLVGAKALAMGLVTFHPKIFQGVGNIFYGHLFLACVLLAYFPFSKLMHMGGVFLSPTRNLPNNTRRVRHINPWNFPVKVHTYEEYEDAFREKMIAAGLPVEKR
ncbi:MAG: sulfate reduction electron transfer complex DsrMKJOP subunit DsrM [Desulfobacterales bacterium]|nr:sulfate reduction electron transfer complex DsrMKJOP subunit DsrM [Desulfobacterales bacterium]